MFPLFPFALGLVTGVVALRLLKSDAPQVGLTKAQERLRKATVSGLEAIEGASRGARERLSHAAEEPANSTTGAAAPRRRKTSSKTTRRSSAKA